MKLNIFFRNETQSVVLKNNRKKIVIIASLFLTVLLFSLIILSSPARGKIQENPYIKSESKSGVLDEVLTIDVSAENTNDKEQYFTLIFDGEGAGLTNDYRFTEDIIKIEDNSGKNITLHREISNDGAINYWFVLSRGETTDFTLKCTSGIFFTCSDDENTSNTDEASELTDEEKEKSNEERLEQKKNEQESAELSVVGGCGDDLDKAKYNTTKHNEIVLKWTDENKGVSASSSNNITPYKLLSASAQETFTGDLSETVHWKFVMNPLSEKGTLIVYGTGAIPDYSDSALNKPSYFKYSRQVTDIIIEEGITGIGTYAFDKMYATGVSFPESLTTIKTFAFRNNTFSTLTIPKNCNQISASAFKYCKIKNLIFEEGVEKVLLDSFYNDGNDVLSELNLPSTLKEFLFRNNPSFSSGTIKKVNIKNNDIYYTKDDILYKKLSDGTSELVLYPEAKNDITEYTVPDNVSAISANAVINNIFEKITVGDNVKSIGENFGGNCFSLKEAVLPQKVTINTFGLFKNCSSLRKFNLPENINVRFPYVSDYVYNSLEEINLPDGITGLDPNIFSNMPNLKKLLYDIPDCNSFNNIKITDSPNFELTVGKKVNHLYGRQDGLNSYDFRSVLAHSENVLFEGENQITIDSKTFENMPVPLKYLEGTVWVDSQGIVYKYDSDKQTAEVAYVPYGRESITVPETITPETSVVCNVNKIDEYAFRLASDLKSVKFDNVTKITELDAYAMAYCSQLSSVNGETTEAGATALFSNANVGYKPFYNTALNGASSSDNFFKEMRGQKSLKINESQMNISVSTNNDNDLEWISNPTIGETEVGGYKTFTGTTLNIISSVSTSVHDDINYRVYFELTEPDGILGISPGETQNAKGIDLSGKEYSIPVTCYATEAPNITYIEFAPKEGITASIYLNAVYSNYISSGGGLRVWGVMQNREESQATKGHIIPYTVNNNKNETIEMYWTTVADDFKLTKSSTGNSTIELIGNSEKGILPKDKLSYSITFERLSASTANYGKDIVKEVDYYDIIKLPDGVKWADDVLANIKAGNVRSSNKSTYENNVRLSNKSVYAGNVQIIDIKNGNNSNALNTYDLNVTYNEEEQNVVISWKSYNNDIKAEIGTTKFLFDIYPDAIRADSALTELTDKTVTNNVTANVKYTYSADRQLSSSAKKDFKLKSAELQFSKNFSKNLLPNTSDTTVYYGGNLNYVLNICNNGTAMYKETEDINAIYTIVDSPDSNVYVSPENMAKMFNDKYGKNFSIKINNAVLSKFTEVTDESGKKAYTNYANSDTDGKTENIEISWKEFGKTLQIITSDKTYEIITDNPSETISEALSEKLKEIGYTVTKNDSYNLVWTLNSVGEQFTLKGGESRDFYVYTNVKDTFNMLTGDYPGRHPSEKINVSNRAYISKKVNNTEKIVGNIKVLVAQAIKREAYISIEAYDNETSKEFNNLNFNPKVGTILDYNLTFSHYGYGKYNNLPMVDDLSGTQVLLVPVSENSELSAYNFEKIYVTEKDGSQKEYYKLSKPGTYTNIKVGADEDGRIRIADNITVEETNTGINTKIKWYFSETESDYYYIKTTLHTYVDNNLIKSANYNINNTVWMNNRTNDRIYATMLGGGTLIDFDKKTVRLDDNGKYAVENDHTIIGSGENVTYRLTLANNENKEFTVNGSDFVDVLPTTCEKFNWERDVNVFIKYSQSGEVSAENTDSWVVEDNKIKWNSDTKIKFKPNSSFEIYVTLIYPDNSQNVWSEYCDEMNGEEIENAFYVYADHRSVYHKLKDKSSAILQKGVYGVSRYIGYGFTEGSSRIYYNNRDYSYRAVEYYVVLYNNGNNRLYINDIYDELPKGFTYKGMIKNSKFNFNKTDPLETADSTDIDISPLTDISSTGTDKIKYRRAIVACEADGQTLKFGISAGSGENAVHLDKNNNRYYLEKNECIVFGYICDVGLTADTDDISINSIAMPYYDYLGVDMETVDSDTVSIHGHLNEQHTDQNDGTRKVEPAEEFSSKYKVYGYNQWLTSTVSVNRGNIVPGVTKYTESYIPADGSGTIPYGGNISSPFATVNWKVRLHNSGTHSLIDYTFEDEMPTPYAVVGSISMNVYDSNGTVTNTFSNILTFSSRTDDADSVTVSSSKGTVYTLPVNGDSVEIKYDNVTNNVMEVSLKRDKNHHETIKIRFKGPIFTIPEDKGYADIFISGKNITTDYENTVYTNIATLKPNIQTFDSAAQGSIIYNDGKPYGVENYAPINVNFSFTTSAFKSVYEINNPTNKTVSNQSDNYITLQNRKNEFRYSLSVSNETKYAMQKLVIIDNLPEPNDTSPFNSTALRGSEFAVLLAENPDFSVKINYDDGTSKILQSNEYSVEFSSRTKFTGSDWNGTGTTGWLKNPENAKSIRIIINNPELVLPKSIVEFSFNAKAEGNVKAGQKAWNSFGYHYILNNDDKIELEAMPLAVGVQIPNVPSIQKKLVDLNGNKFISANDTDFSFIVYSGDRISSDTVNRNELIEVLNNAGRRYKEITLTVKAGESCSEKLKLEFENDKSFWLNNDKYTITETSISGNFKQTMWNNVSSSSVTFTYDAKADVTYICTNTYQNWSFELLKVDDENESKTLQGAEFAIYSPLQSDSMSDEDYNKLSVKPSKTYTDDNSNVWYLCDVKTTDSTGIIKWTDLLRDSYYLVETKAPDNYILNSTPSLITTAAKEQQLKITNHKMIVLPDTGKAGAIAFGFIGIGIILTVISIIFMKRFAKNIN